MTFLKKIDDFLEKHNKLVTSLIFITMSFIVRHDQLAFGISCGMLAGFWFADIDKMIDLILSSIWSKLKRLIKHDRH